MIPTSPLAAAVTAPTIRLTPRAVVTAVFFAFAIGIGLWAGSIPALMRQTGLDVAGLGLGLTLHTGAYVAAMAGGGQVARIVAPRRLMLLALAALAPCFAVLFTAGSPLVLMTALVAVGLSAGLLDLAMNAEGTAVERELGRPVLLSMHAAASAAFAVGALAGSLIATQGGPHWCAVIVLVVTLPVALALYRLGPRSAASVPPVPPVSSVSPATPAPLVSPRPEMATMSTAATPAHTRAEDGARQGASHGVARIGIVLGLTISAEMAAQMWSARFLENQAADLAAFAGAGAAFFAGCQAAVRLLGDPLRRRYGDHRVIMVSLAVAALGLATVAASTWFVQSLVGFALVGLGTACVVPCCFALIARRAGRRAAAALGVAALVAGAIRLPTPLALGAVAATWSEALAFAGVAGGLVIALPLSWRGANEPVDHHSNHSNHSNHGNHDRNAAHDPQVPHVR